MKKYILILITIIAFIGISGCFKKDNNENGNIVIKNSGTIEIKNETPDDNPLHVTNSVSSDGNLLFTANGEYGFRVLDVDGNKTDSNFATVAGYYPYNGVTNSNGVNYSANHVVYKSGNLLVASGVGGVQIFNLSKK